MNKHVEPEQTDKSYQLYGDGTMLIRVDGVLQRRKYERGMADGMDNQLIPQSHPGEMVCRNPDEDELWIATIDEPQAMDVGFGPEEIHPLARIAQLAEVIKSQTQFNTLSGPASNVHAFAHEIAQLVATLSQNELVPKTLTVNVDAVASTAANDYISKVSDRLHSALHSAQAVGWQAYLDAPMHRDMGRSKFNHGVKAAFEHVIGQVLLD